MKLYGLSAIGVNALYGGEDTYPSRLLFASPAEAEADRDAFRERVTNPCDRDLGCLSKLGLEIYMNEYEFVGTPCGIVEQA